MSIIGAVLRELMAAGVAGDELVAAVERVEAKMAEAVAPARTARQERNRRYYEKRQEASEKRLKASEQDVSDVSDAQPSPPPFLSPKPPILPTPTPGSVTSRTREAADFERFWAAYPAKVGKGDARKVFPKALSKIDHHDPVSVLLDAIDRARNGRRWMDGYVPNPSTWLNQERWTDQPDPPSPPKSPTHERSRPDPRQAAFVDRLEAVDSAMAAAVQQFAGGRGA